MKDLILICIAIFLPLGAIVANKLIDKATIKKKDATIDAQREEINRLATENTSAQRAQSTAKATSDLVGTLAQGLMGAVKETAPLMEQAKHVETEADAIELARRQVEAQK